MNLISLSSNLFDSEVNARKQIGKKITGYKNCEKDFNNFLKKVKNIDNDGSEKSQLSVESIGRITIIKELISELKMKFELLNTTLENKKDLTKEELTDNHEAEKVLEVPEEEKKLINNTEVIQNKNIDKPDTLENHESSNNSLILVPHSLNNTSSLQIINQNGMNCMITSINNPSKNAIADASDLVIKKNEMNFSKIKVKDFIEIITLNQSNEGFFSNFVKNKWIDTFENFRAYQQKLKEKEEEETLCSICYFRPKTIALVPCGHYLYCQNCLDSSLNIKCMICNTPIFYGIKVKFT